MKKAISLFLIFSILLLSGNLFAKERKGADLIIKKTDGTQVRGELIAVKENSLLLLERESGGDVSAEINEIKVIRINRPSFGPTALGFVAGIAVGTKVSSKIERQKGFFSFDPRPEVAAIMIALTGLIIGSTVGADTTLQIEVKSNPQIQKTLEKLHKKARIRNAK